MKKLITVLLLLEASLKINSIVAIVFAIILIIGICPSFTVASTFKTNNGKVEFIVFYSDRSGNRDIYRTNVDGSGLIQLTTNTANDQCPSVSPDGKKIAFLSERDGNTEIYVMNADGSNQTRITNNTITEEHPSWSPDGMQIYFMRDYSSKTEIWVMNTDGSSTVQLTNNQCRDERPFLSPDGQTILFMSNRNGNYEIYMMNTDGSNQRRITNSTGHKIFPTWSPDGSRIAYGLTILGGGNPQADIHVMNSDGTGDVTLTNASGRDEDPVWSSDGNKIVFQSERDGNFEVYIMNSDGSNQTRLTNKPSWDGWPGWGIDTAPTGINDKTGKSHHGFRLYPNYPNPFNPSTNIHFDILAQTHIRLEVFNALGILVRTLLDEMRDAGSYLITWDGKNSFGNQVSSGIYFFRFLSRNYTQIQKAMLLQ